MKRSALALLALVLALAFAVSACGGEEEVTATPETVTGTLPTETETDTTDTEPVEEEGDPVAGKEVFLGTSGCVACHTLADAGATGQQVNLDETQPDYALVVDRVTNGLGGMPAFADSLSEEDIQNVAAYISQSAGS